MRRGEEGKEEWGEETGGGVQSFLFSKQTVIEVQFSFPKPGCFDTDIMQSDSM